MNSAQRLLGTQHKGVDASVGHVAARGRTKSKASADTRRHVARSNSLAQ